MSLGEEFTRCIFCCDRNCEVARLVPLVLPDVCCRAALLGTVFCGCGGFCVCVFGRELLVFWLIVGSPWADWPVCVFVWGNWGESLKKSGNFSAAFEKSKLEASGRVSNSSRSKMSPRLLSSEYELTGSDFTRLSSPTVLSSSSLLCEPVVSAPLL